MSQFLNARFAPVLLMVLKIIYFDIKYNRQFKKLHII